MYDNNYWWIIGRSKGARKIKNKRQKRCRANKQRNQNIKTASSSECGINLWNNRNRKWFIFGNGIRLRWRAFWSYCLKPEAERKISM